MDIFPLNDDTFNFFICIEKEVQVLLPSYMAKPTDSSEEYKETVIRQIMNSEDVEWNWTLICQCIDAEEDVIDLLQAIVNPLGHNQGFSITATWMEVYKQQSKKTTKKNPRLRKELIQSDKYNTNVVYMCIHVQYY